jgi:prepilin-type N-terminal cleavage/methylation domain-containing protein
MTWDNMENHKNTLEISHSLMKGMDMFRRSEKGYALVELLLVVVILGILASMAIPRFLVSRDKSWTKACRTNLFAIDSEIEEYYLMTRELPGPEDYDALVGDTARFPSGPPKCNAPGATYSINEDGRAECSFHGNIQGET